jgi:hypothetical protein
MLPWPRNARSLRVGNAAPHFTYVCTMPSLRPSCRCSASTALISLACVNGAGVTAAPKYAPLAGGTGASAGFTVVLTRGAGVTRGGAEEENGLISTTATTAATTTPARAMRTFRLISSNPVPARVELP